MTKKITPAENLIRNIAEYVLAFLIIIECNSLFVNTVNNGSESLGNVCLFVAIGIVSGLVVYYFIRSARIRHDFLHFVPILCVMAVWELAFYFLNVTKTSDGVNGPGYLYRFFAFLQPATVYFWCKRKTGQASDLFLKMSDIICVFALCSFVMYLTVVLRPDSIVARTVAEYWSHRSTTNRVTYYDLMTVYTFTPMEFQGHTIVLPKNIGLYPEPPMFGLALNVALYTEMYLRKKDHRQVAKWVVLTLTLVSTQAILGTILAVIAWGAKCMEGTATHFKGVVRVLLVIAVLLGMAGCIYVLYYYKSSTGERWSLMTHIEDFKIGLRAFKHSPLLGGGYDNNAYLQQFMSENRQTNNPGFTNTVTAILAEGGVVLGLFCMLPYLIGLLHAFTKRNKETALWAMGMAGCYCVVIFQFRMLLLLMMAYGYSSLHVSPKTHFLKLYDTPNTESRKVIRWNPIFVLTAAGLGLLMVFFGQRAWSALNTFLLRYDLYISQSAPKLACFLLIVITAVFVLDESLKRRRMEDRLRGVIGLSLSLVLYGLLYTRIRELVNVRLLLDKDWSDGRESIILLLIYFAFLAVCMLVCSLRLSALRKHLVVSIAIPAAAAGVFAYYAYTLPDFFLRCVDLKVASDMKAISVINTVDGANLYADSEMRLYRALVPTLKYSAARGDDYLGYDAATVIMSVGSDCEDLFNAGWLMTPISDYSVLYTNQPEVISALQAQGYTFYAHDPLQTDAINALTLASGRYQVNFTLHLDDVSTVTGDTVVGTVDATGFYSNDNHTLASLEVKGSDFDENGDALIHMTMEIPDTQQIAYHFTAADGISCEKTQVTVAKVLVYDVRRVYDGWHQLLNESYYDGNGNPVTLEKGYGQIAYTYDRDMNNTSITYEDIYGNPVNTTDGYAIVQRAFNAKKQCISEAYYLSDGTPVVLQSKGYAQISKAYDEDGRQTEEWYYDISGNLVLNSTGAAGWKKTYDENGNTTSITYYGADGSPVIMSYGYAQIRYTYDADNHQTGESYYDENGQPMTLDNGTAGVVRSDFDENGNAQDVYFIDTSGNITTRNDGIAEFHRKYNDNRQIIYEAYFEADGTPHTMDGGYEAVERTYDSAGNTATEKYLDANGNPVLTTWGCAEIHWTYNDNHQVITVSYYDVSGTRITLPNGKAGETRAYDDAGNLIDRKFYDMDGNPVMITDGYAEIQYTYDENNQQTGETHLDLDGNVVG